MIQLVIFPFDGLETKDLAILAMRVIPAVLPERKLENEKRKRSYFAGRCAIAFLFDKLKEEWCVAPNMEFGFLEIYAAQSTSRVSKFVNLSHTDEVAVAAFSEQTIGVDIESRERSAKRVMKRVATEQEKEWIANSPTVTVSGQNISTDIFLWSAKEAFAKCAGIGMKFGLQKFEILRSSSEIYTGRASIQGPLQVYQPTITVDFYRDFIVSLCGEEKNILAGINRMVISRSEFQILRDKLNH